MAEAAWLELPYPEAGVVERDTLDEQSTALAADLPERPLVLGGCCCSHVGAVRGLAARGGRLAVVWLDAHGDLNTPETSPTGNEWGMPLRMLIDEGVVATSAVALVGARNLDPPEVEFVAQARIHTGAGAVENALAGAGAAYVALDCDVIASAEVACFMPEAGGLAVVEVEELLRTVVRRVPLAGVGLTGLRADPGNVALLVRLLAALGL